MRMLRDTSTSTGMTTSPEGADGSNITGRHTKNRDRRERERPQPGECAALEWRERDERAAIREKCDPGNADQSEQGDPPGNREAKGMTLVSRQS